MLKNKESLCFSYQCIKQWPPLAWIALCTEKNKTITVLHGSRVETYDNWFCEAVWDGSFEDANFDHTDIISGSGGRKRTDKITFVSAGNTVDRLVSIRIGETSFISNSLVCLAAIAKFDFLVDHNWYKAFHSIVKGLDQYQDSIPSSLGEVTLTYFHNLVWDGQHLQRIEKPVIRRDFSSFESYHDFLINSLQNVYLNGKNHLRKQPYNLLTTISTGYDSPTVTALAKKIDPNVDGFTFSKTFGTSNDDGSEIARHLKVELHSINADNWQTIAFPEIPHIAADCLGTEVQYTSAESILNNRILLTGFHGDVVWSKNKEDASEKFVRTDQSGLSLTEYRLWVNFFHCPIPFWGARQSADIINISNQSIMNEWDIAGDYSRPICRRIVETSGVPRELFGRKKKAASNSPYAYTQFLTPHSMDSYLEWLQHNRTKFIQNPFARMLTNHSADQILHKLFKTMQSTAGKLASMGYSVSALDHLRKPLQWFVTLDWANNADPPWVLPLRRYLFPWAVEMAKKMYVTEGNQPDSRAEVKNSPN